VNTKVIGRIVSYLFMVGAVVFLTVAIVRQWGDFVDAVGRMGVWDIVAAGSMGALAVFTGMLSWRESVAATAHLIPVGPTTHTFLVSQLGKYVPGSVWAVVAQVQLMRRYGVSRTRGALGSTISMVISLETAVIVGTVGIFLAGGSISTYWWLIPVAVVCTLMLVPAVIEWCLGRLARIHKRFASFADVEVDGIALLRSAAWCIVSWIFWGLQMWLLIRGLGYSGGTLVWFGIGAYALAWSVGRVIAFAPGGIGPREAALVVILATVVTNSDALALAVITRVVMSLLDVLGAALAAGGSKVLAGRHRSEQTLGV